MTSRLTVVALGVATAATATLVLVVVRERSSQNAIWDDPGMRLRFVALGPARFQMGTPS